MIIRGGQNFVSSAPVFSNDATKLLVCTGNAVSIFSTKTGMLATELKGHTGLVTSIVVVPVAAEKEKKFVCFCWTSSVDGSICYWDFIAAELVKKVVVGKPIYSMVIPQFGSAATGCSEKNPNLYAFVSVEDLEKPSDQCKALCGRIQIYSLTESRNVGGLLGETRKPELISVSSSGEFIGIKNKLKLHIWKIPAKAYKYNEIKKIKLHHSRKLSSLAFHPTERIVAGGDVTGRILIWRAFGKRTFSDNSSNEMTVGKIEDDDQPGVRGNDDADSCSTWHWHSSEVHILFFSSDGAYLYSGGKEGVLVVWQLDTGKKRFKPRLGSPLLYYTHSLNPTLSCISCADNQIHLLKMPSMEIIKSISGITRPFSFSYTNERCCDNFVFDQANGLVSLRTPDYCVQFFNLFDNSEISKVQVCERNFQPGDEATVLVSLIALSADGAMMGTVELRLPEEGLGGLVTLKFWARVPCSANYDLTTVVYEPHSDTEVSSLVFRPGYEMAASASYGGEFKIWVHYSNTQQKNQVHLKYGWRCKSVGSYKKMPMTAAAFSADGSVIAVAAETIITLWDPDKNVLVAVIEDTGIGGTIKPIYTLSFAGKSEYLVSLSQGSKSQLTVWDLSKLSCFWSYELYAEAVSTSEYGCQFAVLALLSLDTATAVRDQNGIVLLFDAEKPVPLSTWTVKKAKGGRLSFLSRNASALNTDMEIDGGGTSLLVYMNSDHEYVIFDPYNFEESEVRRNVRRSHADDDETENFGYASIYGDLPKFDIQNEMVPEIPFVPSERPWETIFSESSHVLPPLTKLCSVFFEALLEKRPSIKE